MKPELDLENTAVIDVSVQDFDQICRLCLKKNPFKSVVKAAQDENIIISEFLNETLQLWDFTIASNFPQNICFLCENEIIKIYQFKKQCKENQWLLKEAWEKNEICSRNNVEEDSLDDNDLAFSQDDSGNESNTKSNYQETKPIKKLNKVQQTFRCKICKTKINSQLELTIHRKENHIVKSPRSTCKICKKNILRKSLKQHMRTHSKEKPYQCDICLLSFTAAGNMKRHQMIHTGEKPYVCEHCGKAFIQKYTLQKHMAVHNSIGIKNGNEQANDPFNFSCNLCSRVFKRKKAYSNHLMKHDPNGKVYVEPIKEEIQPAFECDICGKKYKTKYQLKQHIAFHGDKKFLCNECGKKFVTRKALESHLKVHTGEKPYTCTVCGKSFAHLSSFDNHVLIHSGDRPYSCTLCPKKFTQSTHLTIHMRIHSGEKPYTCSYCGKSFALNGNLTVHIRRHTGETPYVCDICNKGFYDSSSLNKHKRGHKLGDLINTNQGAIKEENPMSEILKS